MLASHEARQISARGAGRLAAPPERGGPSEGQRAPGRQGGAGVPKPEIERRGEVEHGTAPSQPAARCCSPGASATDTDGNVESIRAFGDIDATGRRR